jgi:hypothetical protein
MKLKEAHGVLWGGGEGNCVVLECEEGWGVLCAAFLPRDRKSIGIWGGGKAGKKGEGELGRNSISGRRKHGDGAEGPETTGLWSRLDFV